MAKVAEVLVQTLIEAGVKRVYGVAGDSLNGMTETIRKSDKIEWLHVRHEEVAAFAAGAEAHLTNEIAVCAGSCGPGNLQLINGLFDCHRSRVPVLAIAAQIPSHEIGSGYFQETHPEHLFKDCSYYREPVSQPEQMPRVLAIAMRTAITKRGVAATLNKSSRTLTTFNMNVKRIHGIVDFTEIDEMDTALPPFHLILFSTTSRWLSACIPKERNCIAKQERSWLQTQEET
jgi:hypothetical protein